MKPWQLDRDLTERPIEFIGSLAFPILTGWCAYGATGNGWWGWCVVCGLLGIWLQVAMIRGTDHAC